MYPHCSCNTARGERRERGSRAEPLAEVREEGGRTSGRGRGPASPTRRRRRRRPMSGQRRRRFIRPGQFLLQRGRGDGERGRENILSVRGRQEMCGQDGFVNGKKSTESNDCTTRLHITNYGRPGMMTQKRLADRYPSRRGVLKVGKDS